MKINHSTTTSFKAKPLFPIMLKTIGKNNEINFIRGHFSELSLADKEDCALVTQISREWPENPFVCNLMTELAENFHKALKNQNSNKFYITELEIDGDLFQRTKSIMETTNPNEWDKNFFKINILQAANATSKTYPIIRGAGSASMFGATKLAEKNGFNNLYLHSMQNRFYQKLGMEMIYKVDDDEAFFILPKEQFAEFCKRIKDKYFKF